MNARLDELYFDWLYSQVCSVKTTNPSRKFKGLLHILFTQEFVWLVPNDDNRAEDGKDLRLEFMYEQGIEIREEDPMWLDLECSIFELLLGVSRRLEFQTDILADEWFWELLRNLGLDGFSDRFKIPENEVHDILDRFVQRKYEPDGTGGLFPLKDPHEDQRGVEIWYQLSAYVIENDLI